MTLLVFLLLLMGCAGGSEDPIAATPTTDNAAKPKPPKVDPAPTPEPTPTPAPAPLPTITLAFTGRVGVAGTIDGTLTYVTTQGPSSTDIQGFTGNVGYVMTGWDLTVTPGPGDPWTGTVYRNTDVGNSLQWCVGTCVFLSGAVETLTFKNDSAFLLLLVFNVSDPTPAINPPGSAAEWGPLLTAASTYRIPCPVCVPRSDLSAGTMTDGGIGGTG